MTSNSQIYRNNLKNLATNGTDSTASNEQQKNSAYAGLPLGADKLLSSDLHVIRQHELFRARQTEILPATQIRGKCTVVLLSEVETCDMYLNQEVLLL